MTKKRTRKKTTSKERKAARRNYKAEYRLLYEEAQSLRTEIETYRDALGFIASGYVHGDDHTVVHRLRDLASKVMSTLRFAGPVERLIQAATESNTRMVSKAMTPEDFINQVRRGR